jgi:hypothetical protein
VIITGAGDRPFCTDGDVTSATPDGGGLHFVVDSDIVVASETATFLDTNVNIGMVGAIENIGLAKRLPLRTVAAHDLQGRNSRLSAQRAYEARPRPGGGSPGTGDGEGIRDRPRHLPELANRGVAVAAGRVERRRHAP